MEGTPVAKNPVDIEAGEAICARATNNMELGESGNANVVFFDGEDVHSVANVVRIEDRAFLIAARTGWPAALAELRAAREEIGRLRELVERAIGIIDCEGLDDAAGELRAALKGTP